MKDEERPVGEGLPQTEPFRAVRDEARVVDLSELGGQAAGIDRGFVAFARGIFRRNLGGQEMNRMDFGIDKKVLMILRIRTGQLGAGAGRCTEAAVMLHRRIRMKLVQKLRDDAGQTCFPVDTEETGQDEQKGGYANGLHIGSYE